MPLTTTSRRTKRGLRNHPAPLDMGLLGVPGSSDPRRRTILVSAARPSIVESVAALGLNYSLSSGGIPDFLAPPGAPPLPCLLPQVPDLSLSRSSPSLVLDISSDSSHYTTTDTFVTSLKAPLLTVPLNLVKPCTLSLHPSPIRQGSAGAAIRPPPALFDPTSPVTPALLTPAPVRPVRRWGMSVFPQNKVIRRVSSAPSSPTSFDNGPASPTSIIAIKSPVEWRDSKRISAFPSISPLTASLPQETDVPPVPSILIQIPPVPSTKPPVPPTPSSPPPAPTPEDLTTDISVEISRSMSEVTLGNGRNLDIIEESDSPVKVEEKQPPRSPQVKTDTRSPFRGTNSNHRRIPSTHRRESSARKPNRRMVLKRDSGAPFADHVVAATSMATESSSSSTQAEGTEMKEAWRNTMRWSASRKFLRTSTKRAKATVVMMRRGKKSEEKDIVSVIPQLRELKAPRKLRL
ncbi:hypothetical protein BDM02DRAFT_3183703 [Thelephora ganbajun]|uniref:Uncharacterized protein n=1 Tax=Thelephora ganbajun TaxID=370292 RepID=A0ACB6ZRL5_THEGA|nr:hypothetical protein BDM02DRAFT_3183703 [Thelephora ganbajun]